MSSLSSTREKRCNAGNRMGKLLAAEDEDDFYKTTYGGFDEEAEDNDYASEASDSDNVDTDFSIDENDEVHSDQEEQAPKRRKGIDTKAYKEPKPTKDDKTEKVKKPKVVKASRSDRSITSERSSLSERKTLRRSTVEKGREAEQRKEKSDARVQMMKEMAVRKNVREVRRLTQMELLAEAKTTEKINLRALATYQRMELEKKKARVKKCSQTGPVIRYHSVTMPLIEQLPVETEINVVGETPGETAGGGQTVLTPGEKCSRTFITFTDSATYRAAFPRPRPASRPADSICPVTRQRARYRDPVTLTPYANGYAFKLIRRAYIQQTKGNAEQAAAAAALTSRRAAKMAVV